MPGIISSQWLSGSPASQITANRPPGFRTAYHQKELVKHFLLRFVPEDFGQVHIVHFVLLSGLATYSLRFVPLTVFIIQFMKTEDPRLLCCKVP